MAEDDDPNGESEAGPASLLPYDDWTEDALRHVVARALAYAGKNGLPGEHHFYVTFRTDHPGTAIPQRLREKYPEEMTIVLQHQFHNLKVDDAAAEFSVGLSFGGIPTTLTVPLGAVTGFADPHVRFGLRFRADMPEAEAKPEAAEPTPPATEPGDEAPPSAPQVISLDAFRRPPAPKE
jgi:uncharacterized protein